MIKFVLRANGFATVQKYACIAILKSAIANRRSRAQKNPEESPGLISISPKINTVCYFTFSTIALNASGWFMAKSASTFLLISISFFLSNPINCEYDNPSIRAAALIR